MFNIFPPTVNQCRVNALIIQHLDEYNTSALPDAFGNSTLSSSFPWKMPECSLAALISKRRNSLRGPPASMAPSLEPSSSANLTEMIAFDSNFFLER